MKAQDLSSPNGSWMRCHESRGHKNSINRGKNRTGSQGPGVFGDKVAAGLVADLSEWVAEHLWCLQSTTLPSAMTTGFICMQLCFR